jgi:asparagine synthase (glutamine-hydrolysing)
MCGVAGLMSFEGYLEANYIQAMTFALRHRGPDDEGYIALDTRSEKPNIREFGGRATKIKNLVPLDDFKENANLYIGHRRLAIIDLTEAGHQPMSYRGGLWAAYNGEVYNYKELRAELKAKGYEFKSSSDTEVVLAAYACWNEDCVTHFNGDWALCILDTPRRKLFLSRDRYGIKPLYFYVKDNYFAFASEIKALLLLPFVKKDLDGDDSDDFVMQSLIDHTQGTMFKDLHQIMPGENMELDLLSGKMRRWKYYRLPECLGIGEYDRKKAKSYAADVRELLFDSVRLRLRADVPIGTCLSGGLDSSTIVAIMAKLLGERSTGEVQHTFTASFPGQPIDEKQFASSVIDSTRAKSHFVYPSREGFLRDLSLMLYHHDEPFSGTGVYTQWEVFRLASKHVKVTLDGQAGDEIFGGYRNYRLSYLATLIREKRYGKALSEIRKTLSLMEGVKRGFVELKSLPFFVLPFRLKRKLYEILYSEQVKTARGFLASKGECRRAAMDMRFSSNINELLFYYLAYSSLPHLLKNGDRGSMAHSIESRVPFTDFRLVDYVHPLPVVYKIQNGWTKWLLRLSVEDLLPKNIVWRKDKLGFATPPWASRLDIWKAWLVQCGSAAAQMNAEIHHSMRQ